MTGSLLMEKVQDKDLQRQWQTKLTPLNQAIKKLNELRTISKEEVTELEWLEAVMEFCEARDDERNFFWDTFVRQELPDFSSRETNL